MFRSTFVVCSLKSWSTALMDTATNNHYLATVSSLFVTGGLTATAQLLSSNNMFGTTNLVILLVMLTVFFNTGFGIWKNGLKSQEISRTGQQKRKRFQRLPA